MPREDGFYWVKWCGNWYPAHWRVTRSLGNHWEVLDLVDERWQDEDMDEIGERLIHKENS